MPFAIRDSHLLSFLVTACSQPERERAFDLSCSAGCVLGRPRRTTHANLIRSTPICRKYIRKYIQCHTVAEEYAAGQASFDGTAELWFDSIQDKDAFFTHPEYLARIGPDEPNFADLANTKFFVTTEEPILP